MGRRRRMGDPAAATFRLAASPFYWLNRTSSRYVVEMERGLKSVGVDMARWRVLTILREAQPRSISEIADEAAIRLSTITRVVQRLAAAGMVRQQRRAGDARATDVVITASGRRALRTVGPAASAVYGRGTARLSEPEIEQLNGLLRRVFEGLERPGPARNGRH